MALFVMTGATSGLGLHAASVLLRKPGHHLIVGTRDTAHSDNLESVAPKDRLTILPLDTSSIESVQDFISLVDKVRSGKPIRALGLKAGMLPANDIKITDDGYDACLPQTF